MIDLGTTGGFDVTAVEGYKLDPKEHDFSFLTPEYLAGFDGVMMMTNGNLRLTDTQKEHLLDFVRGGKGGSSARTARRSRSTTIPRSATCSAAISGATCRRAPWPS